MPSGLYPFSRLLRKFPFTRPLGGLTLVLALSGTTVHPVQAQNPDITIITCDGRGGPPLSPIHTSPAQPFYAGINGLPWFNTGLVNKGPCPEEEEAACGSCGTNSSGDADTGGLTNSNPNITGGGGGGNGGQKPNAPPRPRGLEIPGSTKQGRTVTAGSGGSSLATGNANLSGVGTQDANACQTSTGTQADGGDGATGITVVGNAAEQSGGGMFMHLPLGRNSTWMGPGSTIALAEVGKAKPATGRPVAFELAAANLSDAIYSRAYGRIPGVRSTEYEISGGKIEWIKSANAFADFVNLPGGSPLGYAIKLYVPADVSGTTPTGAPFHTVEIRKLTTVGSTLKMRVLEYGERNKVTEYRYTPNGTSGKTWEVLEGTHGGSLADGTAFTALRRTLVVSTVNSSVSPVEYSENHKIYGTNPSLNGGSEELLSENKWTFRKYAAGDRLLQAVIDPSGDNLITNYYYYESGTPNGKLKQIEFPDGSWKRFEYSASNRLSKEVRPWLGTAAPVATAAVPTSGVQTIDYSNPSIGSRTIVTSFNSQVTEKIWYTRSGNSTGGYTWTKTNAYSPSASESDADNFKTLYVYFGSSTAAPATNRLKYVSMPGGLILQYVYTDLGGGKERIDTTSGPGSGSYPFTFSAGTKTREERNASGTVVLRTVWSLDSGMGSDPLVDLAAVSVDGRGRPVQWADNLTGRYWYLNYACCGLDFQRSFNGVLTSYTYDALGHITQIQEGYAANWTNTNVFNSWLSDHTYVIDAQGYGRNLTRVPHGSGSSTLVQTLNYNKTGWVTSAVDALNQSTYYRTTLVTESGLKLIREFASLPSSGSPAYYRTGITTQYADGPVRDSSTQACSNTCASGVPTNVSGAENLRENIVYDYATTGSGGMSVTSTSKGYAGSVDRWTLSTTDMSGRTISTSQPSWNSSTPVYSTSAYYASADSAVSGYFFGRLKWSEDADSVRTFYRSNSEGDLLDTILDLNGNDAIDNSSDRVSRTIHSWILNSGLYAGALNHTVNKVLTNGTTELVVSEDWSSADGQWRRSQSFNQWSDSTLAYSGSSPGTLTETRLGSNGSYREDQYGTGRLLARWDDYGSTGINTYYSYDGFGRPDSTIRDRTGTEYYEYYADDRLKKNTDAGSRVTEYTYDNLGNITQVKFPDLSTQNSTYFAVGGLKSQSGSQAYPVEYTYDSFGGRLSTMITHYGPSSSNAVTTWNYSGYRNLLISKTDAATKVVGYAYTAAGRTKTRTWARGAQTRYDYDSAGQLAWKRYFTTAGSNTGSNVGNDPNTGDVNLVLDRNGRNTVLSTGYKSAFPGTLLQSAWSDTVNYWRPLNNQFQVDPDLTDSITTGATAASLTLTQWPSYDGLDRSNGFTLRDGTLSTGTLRAQTGYTYESTGRLSTVTGDPGGTPQTFTYHYTDYSYNLLNQVNGPLLTTTTTWEATRDVLDTRQDFFGTTVFSTFDYTVNNMGQRIGLNKPGNTYMTPTATIAWNYNSQGELTSHNHSDNAYDSVNEYDSIGNLRKTSTGNLTLPGTDNHTANNCNQYTSVRSASPSYDDDGNLSTDGGGNTDGIARTYTWDGENRLIKVTQGGATVAEYLYDALGRRLAKTLSSTRTYFLYDGWNVAAEFTGAVHTTGSPPALTHTRNHYWGLDLSGSLQGAGGVGGLLATDIKTGTSTGLFYPSYDGNGNICDYVNSVAGVLGIKAHYEYSPFGHLLASTGSPTLFNYRFSTKYNDPETDFYYYGYRYYSSWMARWLSRDPIEERGGFNLYGMVGNDALNRLDYLGLFIKYNIKKDKRYTQQDYEDMADFQKSLEKTLDELKKCCQKNNSKIGNLGLCQAILSTDQYDLNIYPPNDKPRLPDERINGGPSVSKGSAAKGSVNYPVPPGGSSYKYPTANGTAPQSVEGDLAHEFEHAATTGGQDQTPSNRPGFPSKAEEAAVDAENLIRTHCCPSQPQRNRHKI